MRWDRLSVLSQQWDNAIRSQMDLNEVRIFVKVVQEGNFRRAALSLGIPKSTVSRKVAELEKRLGVILLHRSTRNVKPTEVGSQFFRRSLFSLSELDDAEREATSVQQALVGKIRLTSPLDVSESFFAPILAEFLRENSQVELEWVVTDRVVDLISEGFDLALRIGPLTDSNLRARKVGVVGLGLFASPEYLSHNGPLEKLDDLNCHKVIRFQSDDGGEFFVHGFKKTSKVPALKTQILCNNLTVVRQLALGGDGVAMMPTFLVRRDLREKKLVEVLKDCTAPAASVHLVYVNHRYVPERLKKLIGFLEVKLKNYFERENL